MAFDISPATSPRTVSNCKACPVQSCPARSEKLGSPWPRMTDLAGPKAPGSAQIMTAGTPLSTLFSVRAGCVKSFTIDAHGNEHVRAFHFPGDLVGLDALGADQSRASAAPVTPSQVCAMPADELKRRFYSEPALAGELLITIQRQLGLALALTGEYTADERVAAFLLHVQARIGSGNILRLPMTRREIGSYLRLATETVCRALTRFEKKGWITSADKRITLHDPDALRALAEPVGLY